MVVAAIANGGNVKVTWGDFQTAATDGKTIFMPKLPIEDSKVEAYALGFAVHETGHIVGTDFSVKMGTGLRKSLVSIFEDARIEAERMKTLPGSRRWLENLSRALVDDELIRCVGEEATLAEQLCAYLLTNLWFRLFGFNCFRALSQESRRVLEAVLPEDLLEALESLALTVKSKNSTQDVADLADEVISLLEQKRDELSQPNQEQKAPKEDGGSDSDMPNEQPQTNSEETAGPGEQSPDQEGSQSTDNDDESSQSTQSNHDLSKGSGDQAGNTSDGAGQDGGNCGQDSSLASTGDRLDDISSKIEQMLASEDEVEAGKDRSEMIVRGLSEAMSSNRMSGASSAGKPMDAPGVAEMQSRVDGRMFIGSVRQQSMALRSRLEEYVQVQTRRRSCSTRSGSRLVRDAASRLALGDSRIFSAERSTAKVVDTAICLLVDCSLSMDGRNKVVDKPIDVAKNAAVALAVALEEIRGVQLSVIGFGTPVEPVTRVMQFGESIRQTAGRIETLRAHGCTPLAEALMVAHSDLLSVDAARRIALVITDGDPDDVAAVLTLVQFGRKHAIEHMGIGIQQSTSHLFPASCSITDVKQLPKAVLDMVQKALFDDRLAA